jgi:ribosomal-protein-serine acetyltransferase
MFYCQIDDPHKLRLLHTSDAEELFKLIDANRTYLRQWLPWLDSTNNVADSENFIRSRSVSGRESTLQQFANNEGFAAAICDNDRIVGIVGLNQIDSDNQIGYIGYWLAASYQGKGIMTKSCQMTIDYAFDTLNLNRLVITCATKNQRSRAIPLRLGFTHEGIIRDAEWLYDRFVDHDIYSLLVSAK